MTTSADPLNCRMSVLGCSATGFTCIPSDQSTPTSCCRRRVRRGPVTRPRRPSGRTRRRDAGDDRPFAAAGRNGFDQRRRSPRRIQQSAKRSMMPAALSNVRQSVGVSCSSMALSSQASRMGMTLERSLRPEAVIAINVLRPSVGHQYSCASRHTGDAPPFRPKSEAQGDADSGVLF